MTQQIQVHPCAHRLLVKVIAEENMSKGGIILTAKDPYDAAIAEVIEMGFSAYDDYSDGRKWCEVGDRILFVKSAGKVLPEELTGTSETFRIINDVDVIARLDK